MLRWGVSILLLTIGLAAPAQALPPEPPPAPLTPADGASVPVNADGIPVTFGCPVYTQYKTGEFTLPGGPKEYGLSMSAAPALGADGRLTNPVATVSGGSAPPPGGDQCAWVLAAGGAQRPQETPGTYYWQVWRFCSGCTSGYETGPVRTLTLTANATLAVKPPRTIYAGYPFILPVTATGVANFTPLAVRRSGGATVGAGTVTSESAQPTVTLSGSTKLSAEVTLGSQTVVSPEVSVKVLRAKTWKTKASDDGAYKGSRSSKFTVAKHGRELRSLTVSVAMLCPTPGMVGQFTTQIGVAKVKTVRLAPDGSFVGVAVPEEATSIRVRGKIGKRKLSGGIAELSVGSCSGTAKFTAKKG
ncbi:hypothetical protein OM076_36615 [Solirubrobacter ginsenosidimutans]|uniref:Ig-like domain repeat protein n=1 Tax=Solirubrobacter ginsenosidimutans TaxID=490573 RepID=A0A9X3N339_9ACTN|nr:hypothetical protein [Solirubrobacter ginsenosidimutans]MDA0165847.1 hypothetical protein [Solirubrobacter ginsenosidimutans]